MTAREDFRRSLAPEDEEFGMAAWDRALAKVCSDPEMIQDAVIGEDLEKERRAWMRVGYGLQDIILRGFYGNATVLVGTGIINISAPLIARRVRDMAEAEIDDYAAHS
jgi:hypothetical protein